MHLQTTLFFRFSSGARDRFGIMMLEFFIWVIVISCVHQYAGAYLYPILRPIGQLMDAGFDLVPFLSEMDVQGFLRDFRNIARDNDFKETLMVWLSLSPILIPVLTIIDHQLTTAMRRRRV